MRHKNFRHQMTLHSQCSKFFVRFFPRRRSTSSGQALQLFSTCHQLALLFAPLALPDPLDVHARRVSLQRFYSSFSRSFQQLSAFVRWSNKNISCPDCSLADEKSFIGTHWCEVRTKNSIQNKSIKAVRPDPQMGPPIERDDYLKTII